MVESLENIKFTNFDTSKVTRMNKMFYSCGSLTYLDISSFYLENLIYSDYMFYSCSCLEEIVINNNTTTKNLKDMNHIFDSCNSLETINIKVFKQNKLTN